MIIKKGLPILVLGLSLLLSCNQSNKTNSNFEKSLDVELDTSSKIIKFENSLFSIPSPYQLSILVKQTGSNYNAELLNSTDNFKQYTTLFKKAINLGIYGADLAYLNVYEQSPSAISYFSVIKMLAQELGLAAAFNPSIFERIENNVDNQDSLLYIISNTYRDIDFFLKENQRQREGALVLAGGWIEGSYFLTKLALETKNEALIQRIGENKQPLENLIKVLSPFYNESEDIAKLVDDLIDLSYEFDGIEVTYKYIEPTTNKDLKLTQIHCKTVITVPQKVLIAIDTKIENIRSLLIK